MMLLYTDNVVCLNAECFKLY